MVVSIRSFTHSSCQLIDLLRFRLVSRWTCGIEPSNESIIVNSYRNMCRFNSGVSF